MGEEFKWSFEAGKYRAHNAFDYEIAIGEGIRGKWITDVEGTSDKFTGACSDTRSGKVTPFTSDDLDKDTEAGLCARNGQKFLDIARLKRETGEINTETQKIERETERLRFKLAPGLEL